MGLVKDFIQKIIKEEFDSLKAIEDSGSGNLPSVRKSLTYEQEVYFMEILQRGDIYEICSAAKSLLNRTNGFWAIASTEDGIPLKHSGLPETITKTIRNIITELYDDISINALFPDEAEIWKTISDDQQFTNILMNAVVDCLYVGDIAFIVQYVEDKILINYERGRNLDYVYDKWGQLKEIIVLKKYSQDNKDYLLKTFYGADAMYVKHLLYTKDGEEVPLRTIEDLADLEDIEITEEGNYIDCSFATQFYINKSTKYEGRGASIFTSKLDSLDSLDEVVSQRQSVLRSGAPKEFIDESCIAKDGNNRKNINNTAMHKFYEKANTSVQSSSADIEVIQSDIRAEEYRIQEEDAKRRCIEGILSEQTISNSSTINNTTITNQREKLTNYTIGTVKKACQNIMPHFVYNVIKTYCIYNNISTEITPSDIHLDFAEYNNPTFETQVEVCSQIKKNKVLPNYEMLQELYGETKEDEEIREIARRLDIMDGYGDGLLDAPERNDLTIKENLLNQQEQKENNKQDMDDSTSTGKNAMQNETNKDSEGQE